MVIPSHTGQTKNAPKGRLRLGLQPTPAWVVIIGFILFTLLGILGAARVLNLAFPVVSFAVSVFLYRKYPVFYMSFTWWIWFLTPLVRRLVDWRSGFSDQSMILMTPLLVSFATLPAFLQYLLKNYPYRQEKLPYVLAFVGIFYSFLIGLTVPLSEGSNIFLITRTSVIVQFVQWIAPISFGFFIFSNWRNYPSFKQNIQRTFFWGGLIMGCYGLVQFLSMPPWDAAWREEALRLGFGNVESQIWSTLNSPGHFGATMIPCLLLLFTSHSSFRIPIAIVGCLAVLLAQTRTAWIGSFIGLFILVGTLKPHLQMRVILAILIVVLSVLPLATIEPFSDLITGRVQTLSNVQEDNSFQARQEVYQHTLEYALINPIGYGMGSLNLADSGILVVLYDMGWLGAIPFSSGLILLFLNIYKKSKNRIDAVFWNVCRAISIGTLVMLPNGNILTGISGGVIWAFTSIIMAGEKYYQYQALDSSIQQNN